MLIIRDRGCRGLHDTDRKIGFSATLRVALSVVTAILGEDGARCQSATAFT
jgi:hypothetical protein